MKKLIPAIIGAVVILAIVLFFVFKPKAPIASSIAYISSGSDQILPIPQISDEAVNYQLADDSVLNWTGRKPAGAHYGTIDIIDGAIAVDGKKVVAGKFIIDMPSLQALDVEGGTKEKLEGHLKGGFFAVESFPTATFVIKGTEKKSGQLYMIGDLTLKWVTKQISFPANVDYDGDTVTAQADFFIDRTEWGVNEVIDIADKYIEFGINLVFQK